MQMLLSDRSDTLSLLPRHSICGKTITETPELTLDLEKSECLSPYLNDRPERRPNMNIRSMLHVQAWYIFLNLDI